MRKLGLALLLATLGVAPAQAQNNFRMPPPAGVSVLGVQVVAACGTGALSSTLPGYLSMDVTGALCTNASGGGGGAVTIANGADVVLGTLTDAASCASGTTAIACLRQIDADIKGSIPAGSATIGNTVNAPTSSSSLALSKVSCGSAVSSCVLKASAGNFYGVYAECTSACWLMVFNSATAPSNGATTAGIASGDLVECIDIGAGSHGGVNYLPIPVAYSVGITAVISSTACASLTLSTVGFVSGSVM